MAKVLHLAAADNMIYPILCDQLLYLRSQGYDIHTASMHGKLAPLIKEKHGIPWTELPLTRAVNPFSDFKALRAIEWFCKQQKFDVVHTHTPKGNLVGQWAAKRARVPAVVQTLHGFYFHDRMPDFKRKVWIEIERFSAKHSDHVLCQNPEDFETAIHKKIVPSEKITLLGNGVDLKRFDPVWESAQLRAEMRHRLFIPPDALVIGMVGRFVYEKGYPELFAAVAPLLKKFPNIQLLLIGHRLESERENERWEPELSDSWKKHVTILENREDMPQLYACMDIHVLPSYREGFPRVLMEAAATGLPQICSNIRGCRQVVENEKNGLLCEPGSIGELERALARLLESAELRDKLGRAARQKALSEFDQIKVFERVKACYEKLLGR